MKGCIYKEWITRGKVEYMKNELINEYLSSPGRTGP